METAKIGFSLSYFFFLMFFFKDFFGPGGWWRATLTVFRGGGAWCNHLEDVSVAISPPFSLPSYSLGALLSLSLFLLRLPLLAKKRRGGKGKQQVVQNPFQLLLYRVGIRVGFSCFRFPISRRRSRCWWQTASICGRRMSSSPQPRRSRNLLMCASQSSFIFCFHTPTPTPLPFDKFCSD